MKRKSWGGGDLAVSDIKKAAVLGAIAEFDQLGRDEFLNRHGFGRAQSFFLEHDGKNYDSKAILGVAHAYSGDLRIALRPDEFSGGESGAARHLRELGFEVSTAEKFQNPLRESSNSGHNFWWVNNRTTHEHEISGNYLWSPMVQSGGRRSEFYDNMTRVREGDVIFAYSGAAIRALGVCTAPAFLSQKPKEFGDAGKAWASEGWRVSVEFSRLNKPLRTKDHMDVLAATLPKKYSPIQPKGNGNQVAYLAAVPDEMARVLIDLLGARWNEINTTIATGPMQGAEAIDAAEDQAEQEIRNRTDIGPTEVLQLVKARRGHGIYRKNLEGFENACRITGVTSARHLRASHIKPWSRSTDFEKLDGNNGLLLSPHIDHLFDRGFISFTDEGSLLVSSQADPDTLARWSVDDEQKQHAFRPDQLKYLAFHREFVFKHDPSH